MYRSSLAKRTLIAAYSLLFTFQFPFTGYSFDRFTMEVFRHEIASSTLNLHYTLTDPKAYKIKEKEPSFGSFQQTLIDEELAYLETCQEKLARYQKGHLSDTQRLTADILDWWITGQLLAKDYYYYQEPLGPTLGIQAQLPVLLAEYPFRKKADIDTYLELLSVLPVYFEEIALFEKEKSEEGLFMNDEILDKILAQCESLFPMDQTHFLHTTFQERLEACDFLDEDQRIAYEAKNLKTLSHYVEPAYQTLCEVLNNLRGTGKNLYGLYHTPEGIEYYEYLLKYSIGTDLSMAKIHQMLEAQMEDDYETLLYAIHQNNNLLDMEQDVEALNSPKEILENLQTQIEEDFPESSEVSWQIKEVPSSLAAYLSPAFYMTPAIDAPQQNIIYINPARKPDRTELITTLAHEGYPGHLYQNSFENTEDYPAVRNLFYIGGYTEGWGLYSEFYAYDFLGLSKEEGDFLRAATSLNYAVCASLDLSIHGEGWTEEDCLTYLAAFGITDQEKVHQLYLNILEEPSNYLKYYLGYLEICNLKESALTLSSDWTLYDFHTWFLKMGPAPFDILREQLGSLEVSSKLLESPKKDFHLFAFESVHNSLYHLFVKDRMFLVGSDTFLC
jgi:uncharacterized protein (DUF885 family)